jgi:hypothetical protein
VRVISPCPTPLSPSRAPKTPHVVRTGSRACAESATPDARRAALLGEQLRRLRERLQALELENEQLRAGGAPVSGGESDEGLVRTLRSELVEMQTENARLREEVTELRRRVEKSPEEAREEDILSAISRELASGRGAKIEALEREVEAERERRLSAEERAAREAIAKESEEVMSVRKTMAVKACMTALLEGRGSSVMALGTILWGGNAEKLAQQRFDPVVVLEGFEEHVRENMLKGLCKGSTLLHAAAACGNKQAVKALLSAGARMDAVDINDRTARDAAVDCGQEPIALYFDEIARRQRTTSAKSVPVTPMPTRTPMPARHTPHAEHTLGDHGL